MASSKITALTADTAPASSDVTVTVDDTVGTPVTKKVTWANVATVLAGLSPFGSAAQAALIDDDTMATATASNVPSAESVVAYVAAHGGGGSGDVTKAETSVLSPSQWGWVVDEDTMVSNSDTKVPTQQSVKAYVDSFATLTTSDTAKVPITTSAGVTTIDVSNLLSSAGGGVTFLDTTFRLYGSDATKLVGFEVDGLTTGTTRTVTFPDVDGTLVYVDATQTLTAKTMTSPTLNSPTIKTAAVGVDRTLTSAGTPNLYASATETINFASGSAPGPLHSVVTNKFLQAGNTVTAGSRFAWAAMTIQNDASVAVDVGNVRIFDDSSTVQADSQTGRAVNQYRSFTSNPTMTVANSGTITSATYHGYAATPTFVTGVSGVTAVGFIAAGSTTGSVTTWTQYKVNNPTKSGAGAITDLYGIDIASLTSGTTTNVGLRNLSATWLGSSSQMVIDTSGNLSTSGSVKSTGTGGLGYATGAGGSVTQATSKSTAVTLNTIAGEITMNNAALANATHVTFTVNNSTVAANDTVICHRISGGSASSYWIFVDSVAAGSFTVMVRNQSGGSLSEAIVLQFAVIKAVKV